MQKILHIDTSTRQVHSISRMLSSHTVESICRGQNCQVEYLDLAMENIPHLDQESINIRYTDKSDWNPKQHISYQKSHALIQQIKQSDIIVMGVAMYNFGIPSTLKAYLDHIVVSGETFISNAEEERGLLEKKKAVILSVSGGEYSSEKMKLHDHVNPYLQTILHFIGINDIALIKAQSTTYFGQEACDLSVNQAKNKIQEYVSTLNQKENTL